MISFFAIIFIIIKLNGYSTKFLLDYLSTVLVYQIHWLELIELIEPLQEGPFPMRLHDKFDRSILLWSNDRVVNKKRWVFVFFEMQWFRYTCHQRTCQSIIKLILRQTFKTSIMKWNIRPFQRRDTKYFDNEGLRTHLVPFCPWSLSFRLENAELGED